MIPLTTNKQTLLALLLAVLLAFGAALQAHATDYEDFNIERTFRWQYHNQEHVLKVNVPLTDYTHYQHKTRYYRNYAWYVGEHRDHRLVASVAERLDSMAVAMRLDDHSTIAFITAFVQTIEYEKDPPTEYPKFPAETLAETTGDCEDSSILLAAILHHLGFQVVLLSPPGHMAVGVGCATCRGPGITYEGAVYHYIETTASGYEIGEVPELFLDKPITVVPLTLSEEEVALLNDEGPLYRAALSPEVYCVNNGDAMLVHQLMSKWISLGNGRYYDSERDKIIQVSNTGE